MNYSNQQNKYNTFNLLNSYSGFSALIKIFKTGMPNEAEMNEKLNNVTFRDWFLKWIVDYMSYLQSSELKMSDKVITESIMSIKMSQDEIASMQSVLKELFIAQLAVTLSMVKKKEGASENQNEANNSKHQTFGFF